MDWMSDLQKTSLQSKLVIPSFQLPSTLILLLTFSLPFSVLIIFYFHPLQTAQLWLTYLPHPPSASTTFPFITLALLVSVLSHTLHCPPHSYLFLQLKTLFQFRWRIINLKYEFIFFPPQELPDCLSTSSILCSYFTGWVWFQQPLRSSIPTKWKCRT